MGLSVHLSAGFSGGLLASVLLQPLDLAKTRLQQGSSPARETWNALLHDSNTKGVLALWRGTLPSALRMSIGASLYLASLGSLRELAANALHKSGTPSRTSTLLPSLPMAVNLVLGAGTRAAVGFVTMPLTIIKARYESNLYNYRSMSAALSSILAEPRGWRNLFTGYTATALRDAPYAGLYVLGYEKAKDVFGSNLIGIPHSVINASAAVTAAVAATTVTAPFDTIKTRMQLKPRAYDGLSKSISLILADGGIRGFFDGVGLRLVRKAASSGIAWCVYEEIVRYNSGPKPEHS